MLVEDDAEIANVGRVLCSVVKWALRRSFVVHETSRQKNKINLPPHGNPCNDPLMKRSARKGKGKESKAKIYDSQFTRHEIRFKSKHHYSIL